MLFDIFVRKYGYTSKITSPLHLVEIDTDPDPTKLCRKDRIQIHNTGLYDDENKSLPLTVELLEGVIHGTPVSELHQPVKQMNNYQTYVSFKTQQQQSINTLFSRDLGLNNKIYPTYAIYRYLLFMLKREAVPG